MKKYLSFFAAALLFAACQSDDIVDQKGTTAPKGSIQFGVASTQNLTRTPGKTIGVIGEDAATYEESIKSYGFGVFGCYTGNNVYENVTVTPDFMYNQEVTLIDGPSTGVYTGVYNPVKYWPNTGKTTFFAYAPYVDHTQIEFEKPYKTHCIAGMSQPGDEGDPWLIYVLADDPFNYFSGQSDLLIGGQEIEDGSNKYVNPWYNLEKANATDEPMRFTFYHALGIVGDQIKITVTPELKTELSKAENHNAKLYIDHIDMKFKNLTRKAKLILNSKQNVPNWKPIVSGEVTTTREYTITRDDIKTASDKLSTTNHIYSTEDSDFDQTYYNANDGIAVDAIVSDPLLIKTGKGLFYIPYQVAQDPQQVEVTVHYQVLADGMEIFNGEATSTTNLSEHNGKATDIVITLGKNLKYDKIYAPKVGNIYYSDGTWGNNEHAYGAVPIGVVCYIGDDIPKADGSMAPHGLVMALSDARKPYSESETDVYPDYLRRQVKFGSSTVLGYGTCSSFAEAYDDVSGESNTKFIFDLWNEQNYNNLRPAMNAAYVAAMYEAQGVGARGNWHLGSFGEWVRVFDAIAKAAFPSNPFSYTLKQKIQNGEFTSGVFASGNNYFESDPSSDERLLMGKWTNTYGISSWLQNAAVAIYENPRPFDRLGTECIYWTSTQTPSNLYVYTFRLRHGQQDVGFYGNGDTFANRTISMHNNEVRMVRPLMTF